MLNCKLFVTMAIFFALITGMAFLSSFDHFFPPSFNDFHSFANAQDNIIRPVDESDENESEEGEDEDEDDEGEDEGDHEDEELDVEEMEIHRFHLEIQYAETELQQKQLSLTLQHASAAENALDAAALAIAMTPQIMDEQEAAKFLNDMLDSAKEPEIKRLLQLKLAPLYAELDQPEKSKQMLKALLQGK